MNVHTIIKPSESKEKYKRYALRALAILGILLMFLLSLDLISGIFSQFGKSFATEVIIATSNPFVGMVIGLLATAILQSSSTTTSILVAIVSSGTLPLESAIPIVMGANIGTTVTSTLVSLGHITKKKEFRKAIAAASLHDVFNILTIAILFPLELFTGFLSASAQSVASALIDSGIGSFTAKIIFITHWVNATSAFILSWGIEWPWLMLGLSVVALFACLRLVTQWINLLLIGEKQQRLENTLFETPRKSIASGFLLTTAVQSSSLTTSIIVPFVAKGKVSVKQIFPFIMGANIGTTITALIAAISKSDAAISLALVHLFINLIGVLLFFPIPLFRALPIYLARKLGKITVTNRLYGFLYILFLFFTLPFLLILLSQ